MRLIGKVVVPILVLVILGGGVGALSAPKPVEQAVAGSTHREREHFFLPPRSLYHFRPELYVLQQLPIIYSPFHLWRPAVTVPFAPAPRFLMGTRSPGAYRLILQTHGPTEIVRANFSDVVFEVTPRRAMVYVNDKLIGSAGDFSTRKDRLILTRGEHRVLVEFPGFKPYETVLKIHPNRTLHLTIELEPVD